MPDAMANLRAKYPQYANIPDGELAQKIVAKYPQYKDSFASYLSMPTVEATTKRPLGATGTWTPYDASTVTDPTTGVEIPVGEQPTAKVLTGATIAPVSGVVSGGKDLFDSVYEKDQLLATGKALRGATRMAMGALSATPGGALFNVGLGAVGEAFPQETQSVMELPSELAGLQNPKNEREQVWKDVVNELLPLVGMGTVHSFFRTHKNAPPQTIITAKNRLLAQNASRPPVQPEPARFVTNAAGMTVDTRGTTPRAPITAKNRLLQDRNPGFLAGESAGGNWVHPIETEPLMPPKGQGFPIPKETVIAGRKNIRGRVNLEPQQTGDLLFPRQRQEMIQKLGYGDDLSDAQLLELYQSRGLDIPAPKSEATVKQGGDMSVRGEANQAQIEQMQRQGKVDAQGKALMESKAEQERLARLEKPVEPRFVKTEAGEQGLLLDTQAQFPNKPIMGKEGSKGAEGTPLFEQGKKPVENTQLNLEGQPKPEKARRSTENTGKYGWAYSQPQLFPILSQLGKGSITPEFVRDIKTGKVKMRDEYAEMDQYFINRNAKPNETELNRHGMKPGTGGGADVVIKELGFDNFDDFKDALRREITSYNTMKKDGSLKPPKPRKPDESLFGRPDVPFTIATGAALGAEKDEEGNWSVSPGKMIVGTILGAGMAYGGYKAFEKLRGVEARVTEAVKSGKVKPEQAIGYTKQQIINEMNSGRLTAEEAKSLWQSLSKPVSKEAQAQMVDALKTPNSVDERVRSMTQALKELSPLASKQTVLRRRVKQKQAAELSGIESQGLGEEGYYRQLGALKGELPKVQYESMRGKFAKEDIDWFYNQVGRVLGENSFDVLPAKSGLQKLFSGEATGIPSKHERAALRKVFGNDFASTLEKASKTGFDLWREAFIDTATLPRTLLSSFDMSMPLRQGVILTTSHPIKSWTAMKDMHKAFFSEKAFRKIEQEIWERPNAGIYDEAKLAILKPNDPLGKLTGREEAFLSRYTEKIPLVRNSARAAYTYLNKLRADVFDMYAEQLQKSGLTMENAPEAYEATAQWINIASGRGGYGRFTEYAPALSVAMFSPRLLASRFQAINPKTYANLPKPVRMKAIYDVAKFVGAGTGMLALAKLGGASVEVDPRSADFGKMRIGNTRLDPWGGFVQIARLIAQLSTGERKTLDGRVIKMDNSTPVSGNRLSTLARFAESKLNPQSGLVVDMLRGKDFAGENVTFESELYGNITPLYLQDLGDAIKEFGPLGAAAVTAPAFYGVGVQTYEKKPKSSPSSPYDGMKVASPFTSPY